ncbi:MAG: hypothetical protein GYB68_19425 [Chloroflexi bacterium]|nr:hypothetical protein [Chloroflexota bacterium]
MSFSLFQHIKAVVGDQVQSIKATKATLVHMSHAMEDVVLRNAIPALMFTGFQESTYWKQETARYRELAKVAKQITIFAGKPLPPDSENTLLQVTLEPDDKLRQEWFVLILSERFSVVLCGLDNLIDVEAEGLREFETIWSFQPDIIGLAIDEVERVLQQYHLPDVLEQLREARLRYPLGEPDPNVVTHFVAEILTLESAILRDVLDLKQQLEASNQALEERVRQRTVELEILADDLRLANERLKELGRVKDEFVSNISHELRTPVASLRLYHRLLELYPARVETYVERLKRETTRMETLVENLLSISQMEARLAQANKVPTDLSRIVNDLLTDRAVMIDNSGLEVSTAIEPGRFVVHADRYQIERAIGVLIANAVHYTPAPGRIIVSLARKELGETLWAVVAVQDSGPGISEEEQPQVFERFYRGAAAQDTYQAGIGLGLSIARQVIDQHNGKLTLSSQLGRGSTFSIWLPILKESDEAQVAHRA